MRLALQTTPRCLVLAAFAALTPLPASTQSVSDIVDQMYEEYERQSTGIDNYTLVQSVMGFETSSYFEKELVEGRPVFMIRETSAQGQTFQMGEQGAGHGQVFLFGDELAEHARYAGREQVDGNSTHVLAIDDLSQIEALQPQTPEQVEFTPRSGRIFVDAEMMVPRRIEFIGDAQTANGSAEITMRMDMQDFRTVEGLVVPYRTVMQFDGFQSMLDPETLAQLEQMEQQLANLPPEQREMMERMLGPQMDQIRQMMAGDGGPMTTEVTVSDVRINSGPPGE